MKVKCDSCNGTGQAYVSCCTQEIVDSDTPMCPLCHEHLGEEDCPDCDGTGEIEVFAKGESDIFSKKLP